jgi:ankyrin repeat protein
MTCKELTPQQPWQAFDHNRTRGSLLILAALDGNNSRVQEILKGLSAEQLDKIIEKEFNGNYSLPAYILSFTMIGDPRPYKESALLTASLHGKKDIVEQLLLFGANINVHYDDTGETPLILAARRGHTEIVQLLIQRGADLKQEDHDKKNALDYARAYKKENVVTILEAAEQAEAEIEQSWLQKHAEQDNLPD